MKNKEVVKEWIEKADEDFEFATSSLKLDKFFAQICFHFHQAAEKYLKAFIIAHQLEFKPIHNLLKLLEICSQKEPKIKEIEEACRYLNPFYVDTRYPVHWPTQYNKDSSLKAEQAVREVREWIRNVLKLR